MGEYRDRDRTGEGKVERDGADVGGCICGVGQRDGTEAAEIMYQC